MERRFYSLDAMRGIAASMVVIYHIALFTYPTAVDHAFLAVDFFFMLSGFVLARIYEPRLKMNMQPRRFIRIRAIRLYPLFALGMMMGALGMVGQAAFHTSDALSTRHALLAFSLNILMLPAAVNDTLFPPNLPDWSLFFEMLINILFAIFLFRLTSKMLSLLCGLLGAIFLVTTIRLGDGNMGPYWPTVLPGLVRTCFGFSLGILFARWYREPLAPSSGVASPVAASYLSILPVMALGLVLGGRLSFIRGWIYDSVAVFLALPLLLWLGISLPLPKAWERIGAFLGDISYALYAIHYPLLQAAMFAVKRLHLPEIASMIVYFAAMMALSWMLAFYFDAPVRKWLSQRFKVRMTAAPVALG